MSTIRELRDRDIVLKSVREGIDTSNATGRMVAGVLASLTELELELGKTSPNAALAKRMHASGESAGTIAATLGVSRATVYRVLAEDTRRGTLIAADDLEVPAHRARDRNF
jgi:DNA invertase Pin-like site-specific DNA recombinase